MTNNCRAGRVFLFMRWICFAALLGSLSACAGGSSETAQAVGSDSDNSGSAPPSPAEQLPDPEPAPLQCNRDNPEGDEVVLLAGQSNANTGLIAALNRTLTARGITNWPGDYRVDGNPIRQWVSENGVLGPTWAPMMADLDRTVQQAANSGNPLNGLNFVWFQGESDVGLDDYPLYEARLRQLVSAVQNHAEKNWKDMPAPAFALALPDYKDAQVRDGIESVREAIRSVANDSANVCAFDTRDINRYDLVHIPNYPGAGSPEQFIVAERALACGRVAANRCESTEAEN